MEENIKIQEEFEQLIDQLEILRNINELTSANTESSREVILNIGTFVKTTNEYAKSIELNLGQKSIQIDKLLVNLEKSIFKIESETKLLSTNVGTSFSGFKNETQSNFNEILLELKKALEGLAQIIDNSKISIIDSISESCNQIIQNENKQIQIISENFTRSIEILTEKIDHQNKKIEFIKIILYVITGLIIMGTFVATIF